MRLALSEKAALLAKTYPAKSFRSDILEGYSNSPLVFKDLQGRKAPGYLLRKSFKRDILRGYL